MRRIALQSSGRLLRRSGWSSLSRSIHRYQLISAWPGCCLGARGFQGGTGRGGTGLAPDASWTRNTRAFMHLRLRSAVPTRARYYCSCLAKHRNIICRRMA